MIVKNLDCLSIPKELKKVEIEIYEDFYIYLIQIDGFGYALHSNKGDNRSNLYVLKTDDDQLTKIAVAAGKRLGNAVIRNRIKRKMREVFRYEKSNIQNGYHIIWIAKKPLINASIVIFKKIYLVQKAL